MSRIFPALALTLLLGLLFSAGCLLDSIAGVPRRPPSALASALGPEARDLIREALRGIPPQAAMDYHTHLIGLGVGGTGAYVNADMRSVFHPIKRMRFGVYARAAGVQDFEQADSQYLQRLVELIRHSPLQGRHALLAFDRNYQPDGQVDEERTAFYVPNRYVFAVAARYPDVFVPVMSIHPYRKDARAALERWAAAGGKMMKWLPNSMGIDPASPRLDPFYDRMRELGVVLLSHGGREEAVDATGAQSYGNPLRLRRALDRGVTVIVAHCAGLGMGRDEDKAGDTRVSNFELFVRLAEDPRYRGRVFGDLSAMTQFNRQGVPLKTLLERPELHDALVNGSDYPLPAIDIIIRTRRLVEAGYISEAQRRGLNEIYGVNPLLFDFVVKRSLRPPKGGAGFPAAIFTRDLFSLAGQRAAGPSP